jgi:hypothetical protein
MVTMTTAGTIVRAPTAHRQLAQGVVFGRRTIVRMHTRQATRGLQGLTEEVSRHRVVEEA